MKVDAAVKKTTLQIGAGVLAGTVVMFIVFALLGQMDYTVVLGGLLGALTATGNFFLMGLAVQQAAAEAAENTEVSEEEENTEAENGEGTESSTGVNQKPLTDSGKRMKKRIQVSYSLRMGLLILIAICAALLPCFHVIAFAIPLILPRFVIMLLGFRKQ